MLNTEKLRQLRETKQLKQETLANLLNISQSNYAKIESGKLSIRLDVLEKLAKVLEIPPNELLKTENTTIQLNSNNNNGTNNSFTANDIDLLKSLYEKLLVAEQQNLKSKDELIEVQNKRIQDLETALQKT